MPISPCRFLGSRAIYTWPCFLTPHRDKIIMLPIWILNFKHGRSGFNLSHILPLREDVNILYNRLQPKSKRRIAFTTKVCRGLLRILYQLITRMVIIKLLAMHKVCSVHRCEPGISQLLSFFHVHFINLLSKQMGTFRPI